MSMPPTDAQMTSRMTSRMTSQITARMPALLAGFIGRSRAPAALGVPYVKTR